MTFQGPGLPGRTRGLSGNTIRANVPLSPALGFPSCSLLASCQPVQGIAETTSSHHAWWLKPWPRARADKGLPTPLLPQLQRRRLHRFRGRRPG